MSGSELMRGLTAAVLFGTGARMVFRPEAFRDEGRQNNDRAIAERLARGHDRYFEELRALRAYSEPRPIRTIRLFGLALMLLAGCSLLLLIF